MFLVDVARYKENAIPLALFDNGKKISLDFLCITAENRSYADPGVLRVYDVCSIVDLFRLDNVQVQRDPYQFGVLVPQVVHAGRGEIHKADHKRGIHRLAGVHQRRAHCPPGVAVERPEDGVLHEDAPNQCRMRWLCVPQNAIIYIFNKLYDLYLKSSIPVKNINLSSINEQAVLDGFDSYCLLFNLSNPARARLVTHSR